MSKKTKMERRTKIMAMIAIIMLVGSILVSLVSSLLNFI